MLEASAGGGGGIGGNAGTVKATPAELQKAGQGFQTLSNACGEMAQSEDLKSGGALELEVLQFPGGAGQMFALPSGLKDDIQTVTQGVLGVLVSAQQQFADAAMDLFQVAGDFHTADTVIPSGARPMPNALGVPKGIATYVYMAPDGTEHFYYKDSSGTVVGDPTARFETSVNNTNNPYEKTMGQSYHQPKGK